MILRVRGSALKAGLSAVALIFASATASATTYTYDLNGSYAEAGGGPSLNPHGGSLITDPTGYTFGINQGLDLSNVIGLSTSYSIELKFRFDDTGGYGKIVDFKDLTTDNGLYNRNSNVSFYPVVEGAFGSMPAGEMVDLLLTRSAVGLVTVSVGSSQVSFNDVNNYGTFTGSSNIYFFIDDNAFGGEWKPGFVDQIVINTDDASATPLPAALPLFAGGLGLMGMLGWRRKRKDAAIAA